MSFIYPDGLFRPLDRRIHEVRILNIHADLDESIIRCTLTTEVLFRLESYAALSYSWGTNRDSVEIIVNDWRISVTKNLGEALRYLRKLQVRRVWVDALCISQQDDQEKSDQIRHITQIYSKATATYAWLGSNAGAGAVAAMKFLQQVADGRRDLFEELLPKHHDQPALGWWARLSRRFLRQNQQHKSDEIMLIGDPDRQDRYTALAEEFSNICDFLRCDYWQRRWIIQEIAVSAKVYICYGEQITQLENIASAIELCRRAPYWYDVHRSYVKHFDQIIDFRRKVYTGRKTSLCETVLLTHDYRSDQIHDRIFALMGICTDGAELIPIPNYFQSMETILSSITRDVIRKKMSYDIILMDNRHKSSPALLPSWVPDLLSPNLTVDAHNFAMKQQNMNHSYITQGLSGKPEELILQGTMLGSIVSMTSTLGTFDQDGDASQILPPANMYDQQASTDFYRYSPDDIRHAMVETLLSPKLVRGTPNDKRQMSMWRMLSKLLFDPKPFQIELAEKGLQSLRQNSAFCALFHYVRRHKQCQISKGNDLSFHTNRSRVARGVDRWLQTNQNFNVHNIPLQKRIRFGSASANFLRWLLYKPAVRIIIKWLVCICLITPFLLTWPRAIYMFRVEKPNKLMIILTPTPIPLIVPWIQFCKWWRKCLLETQDMVYKYADSSIEQDPRRLVICDNGRIATTVPNAQVGDYICLIAGCSSAVVLRPTRSTIASIPATNTNTTTTTESQSQKYQVIGRALVYLTERDLVRFSAFALPNEPSDTAQSMQIGAGHAMFSSNNDGDNDNDSEDEYMQRIRKHQREKWWQEFIVI